MKKTGDLVLWFLASLLEAILWLFADKCPECGEVLEIEANSISPMWREKKKFCANPHCQWRNYSGKKEAEPP